MTECHHVNPYSLRVVITFMGIQFNHSGGQPPGKKEAYSPYSACWQSGLAQKHEKKQRALWPQIIFAGLCQNTGYSPNLLVKLAYQFQHRVHGTASCSHNKGGKDSQYQVQVLPIKEKLL